MAGFDTQRVIAAYQAGQQIKQQKEQQAQQQEDRALQQKVLKHQIDRLKIEDAMSAREAALQNFQLAQGQPAQEVPGMAAGGQSGLITPVDSTPMPLPKMNIPGIPGMNGAPDTPGVDVQPQSLQDILTAQRNSKVFDSQLKQMENQVTVPAMPGIGLNQPLTTDKSVVPTILSQAGQNTRQADQQNFTKAENEKRLKAESVQKALDRASRLASARTAAASRIDAAVASQNRTQANTLANKFGSEKQVQEFQVIQQASDFVKALPDNTDESADDQALLYAFAKAMDPNSVVREGEYATVQKYSQSWADTFGFNAKRVFESGPFLTEAARKQMKATIDKKVGSARKSYDTIFNEYTRKLDKMAPGKGKDLLVDYAFDDAQGGGPPPQQPQSLVGPNGVTLTLGSDGKYHASN